METLPVEDIHKNSLIIDAHSDVPIDILKRRRAGEKSVLSRIHIPEWKRGGINALILTVSGDESSKVSPKKYTFESIKSLQADIQECTKDLAFAYSARDLIQIVDSDRIAIMMNIEGCY